MTEIKTTPQPQRNLSPDIEGENPKGKGKGKGKVVPVV
jgi:hypothetical protein